MSRCLIVYYSQGNTTKKIAEAVAKGIRAGSHEVDLHNLKDGPPPDHGKYDMLGIGVPAHYYRPAIIMSDYLDTLSGISGKPVFTFVLHGATRGDAGNRVRRELEKKGGKELGYAHFFGESHFLGYLKQGYQFSPRHPKPDAVAQAEAFGRDLAARTDGRPFTNPAYDPALPMIFRLERFLTNRFLIRNVHSRLFRWNRKKCSGCGLCMKQCPTGNIREDASGAHVWGRNCILCFSCELNCPKEAISAPVLWFMFWPFMVYNTRHEASNPAIEHIRVKHANGRTIARD